MKAWFVSPLSEQTGYIVFADTSGKARRIGVGVLGEEFVDVSVKRLPAMDGDPHPVKPREYLSIGYFVFCAGCERVIGDDAEVRLEDARGELYCNECDYGPTELEIEHALQS